MQRPAHLALQGVVDHLVLLYAGLARELLGHDMRREVVAVACEVGDGDLGIDLDRRS